MAAPASENNVLIVTSWSKKGYDIYGQRMLETAREFHVRDMIYVFSEHGTEHLSRKSGHLDLEPLKRNMSDARYRKAAPRNQAAYLRWGAKVLALWEGVRVACKTSPEWLVWLDGDTEWTARPSPEWWAKVLPEDKAVSALLRDSMGWEAETGFVGYHIGVQPAHNLVKAMRDLYVSGDVFDLPQWWDGAVFTKLLRELVPANLVHNLAPAHPIGIHVWPESPLCSCLRHNKGVGRKAKATGKIDADHPSSLPGPAFGPKGR